MALFWVDNNCTVVLSNNYNNLELEFLNITCTRVCCCVYVAGASERTARGTFPLKHTGPFG